LRNRFKALLILQVYVRAESPYPSLLKKTASFSAACLARPSMDQTSRL